MISIQPIEPRDWPEAWKILHTVFAAGDTFAYAPETTERQAHTAWVDSPLATFIAKEEDGTIAGIYYLKPNQPGLGSHIANAGYVVSVSARGRGIATQLCEHSQEEAKRRGFLAMQFNLVVSTNEIAVRLWQKLGFTIVGRVPDGFQHRELGLVDTFVMWKRLAER
ncbi:MAG TPA: GNAT family N-acetyltransferase [Polyangiaceae bacterium]|jgi:ribosomal protein S18 acetylase RimI-like enzyme